MHAHTTETTTRTLRASRRGSPTGSAACGRPTTGRRFESLRESDIEHVIAVSEAHDSGLVRRIAPTCGAASRRDLDNLTLATPRLNRNEKGARDAAEWLPARNRCWFAATIVAVRREYGPDHRPERSGGPRCGAQGV